MDVIDGLIDWWVHNQAAILVVTMVEEGGLEGC